MTKNCAYAMHFSSGKNTKMSRPLFEIKEKNSKAIVRGEAIKSFMKQKLQSPDLVEEEHTRQ